MTADGNVNKFANTIVHHPAFRETINAILPGSNTRPSSPVSPGTIQTDNRSRYVTSTIGINICNTDKNLHRFDSLA